LLKFSKNLTLRKHPLLLIRPASEESAKTLCSSGTLPKGIVAAMIANLEIFGLSETAMKIAEEFMFLHDSNNPKLVRVKPHDLQEKKSLEILVAC